MKKLIRPEECGAVLKPEPSCHCAFLGETELASRIGFKPLTTEDTKVHEGNAELRVNLFKYFLVVHWGIMWRT
jgi:hypothetical protein